MERVMIGQFPNSLHYRPAYLSGRFGRFEGEFATYETLEQKPYGRLPQVGDRLPFVGDVAHIASPSYARNPFRLPMSLRRVVPPCSPNRRALCDPQWAPAVRPFSWLQS